MAIQRVGISKYSLEMDGKHGEAKKHTLHWLHIISGKMVLSS